MQALTNKQTASRLTALNNATKPEALQELFANLVYQALVHGNGNRERLAVLRDNKGAPQKFKVGLMKHMPMKWDKTAKQYNFDAEKANELRLELGIEYQTSTFEEVAEALPDLFAKRERQTAEFNMADYLAKVAKKLDKEGIANADDLVGLVALLANNPEATKAAQRAAYDKTAGTIESNVA